MKSQTNIAQIPSGQFLKKLVDSLHEVVCALDPEGRFVYLNKACYTIWGYQPEELIGRSCYDLMVKEDHEVSHSSVQQVQISLDAVDAVENRYYRKDGSLVTMRWEGGGYDPQTGLIYCAGRDVSGQRKLEALQRASQEELQATKEELEQLVERITDGFLGLDESARVIYWNKAAEQISQLTRTMMIGYSLWDVLPEPTRSLARQKLAEIRQTQTPLHVEYFAERIKRWIEVHAYISGTGVSVFFRDVTERRLLQEQLIGEKEEQQKKITQSVIKATDEERAFVGKELHDNVNQVLTTIKLYTEMCLSGTERQNELLNRSLQLLQNSIEEIRGLSKRLSSPSFDGISLKDSIGDLVEAFNVSERIAFMLRYDAGPNVPEAIHITVYRILQEHFTNIIKHAAATRVQLRVWEENGVLKITVDDNGRGFNPTQSRKGIGLANMNSRAEAVNAKLQINSAPGDGCRLYLELPVKG